MISRSGLSPADARSYLRHLNVTAPATPSAAALDDLVRAHVRQVPFENTLIQLGRPAPLHTATTVHRIVRGGGGYCLELNAAFGALLRTLGYHVSLHEGHCWASEPDPPDAPVNQLTLIVTCADAT
jgi:N-hydroxyarylamine O-acetyltransferase